MELKIGDKAPSFKCEDQNGEVITEKDYKGRYDKQTSPYYAAARLWVDAIIDPVDTRKVISEGINAANGNAEINELRTGVFQV